MTIQTETENGTEYEQIKLEKPKREIRNFYLVFGGETTYTEFKSGIGMKFDFRVSNDTIYQMDKPEFKIVSIDSGELILRKIDTGKERVYIKSNDDLSKFKVH
ncbi:hypothetical protein QSV08_15375 [Maribacter sp. BPC-D8]|uniref:hypothetical protein n=1 Tax=Maribacter sp. BPC-D8 TaxID=3053613 RepID=UPI002B48F95E|nr:hypothetical protein [Maribacter sp. BPC-D8]WRI28596.1 hypothetical protein QSV08_15375 [Maribacter sp. BPC-D8]